MKEQIQKKLDEVASKSFTNSMMIDENGNQIRNPDEDIYDAIRFEAEAEILRWVISILPE